MDSDSNGPQIIKPTNQSPTDESSGGENNNLSENSPSAETAPQESAPESVIGSAPTTETEKFADTATEPAQNPAPPVSAEPASTATEAGNGPMVMDGAPVTNGATKVKKHGKKFWIPVMAGVVAVIVGGGAYAYFGVYMSSSFVWKQSLGNMNKGYSKLVGYLNTQSSSHYKGLIEAGSFKVVSDGNSYDGSINTQSDGNNSTFSAKADFGVAKLDLEERSIKAAGNSEPDVYLQLSGIKSLDSSMGNELGPQIDSLDGKWIVVDHNLIIDLKNQLVKQQKADGSTPQLTWADINSFLQAAGNVNKQYVFTTDSKTAVTKVVKTYGRETVDGHDTYHYKVAFVPAHVQAYVTAMCSALQTSDLGAYIKQETGQSVGTSSYCKDLEKSAGQIKSSSTIDVWADVSRRMIYKIRIYGKQNPAENFVDIGLNYKGGNQFPFFFSGQTKDSSSSSTFKVTATLNTDDKSITVALNANAKDTSNFNINGNFSIRPSNAPVNVQAPKSAVPIATVLNEFGLGGYLQEFQSSSSNSQLGSLRLLPPNNLASNHETRTIQELTSLPLIGRTKF